jgi:hypothetical protein
MSHTCQREVNEIGSASTKLHRRFRAAFSLAVSVGGGGEVSAVALAAALIAGQMGSQPHKVAVAAVVVVAAQEASTTGGTQQGSGAGSVGQGGRSTNTGRSSDPTDSANRPLRDGLRHKIRLQHRE